jgi:two-component system response regulator TctD
MRVLLVEDTEDLGQAVAERFRRSGHAVDWVSDGEQADSLLRTDRFDLILLDMTLPRMDGFEVLRRLRRRGDATPVLILTARAEVDDRVDALDIGADDYLVKPFDFRELEARSRVLLRRQAGAASAQRTYGRLLFDELARRVFIDEEALELPQREYRLLEIFLAAVGRVLSKEEIADHLFGIEDVVGPNVVELYVGRLRKKLEGTGVRIRTLRGLGYVADVES